MTSKLVRHVNLTIASVAGIVYAIDHVTNHVPTRMARVAWAGAATYADFKQNVLKRPEMEHSHPSEMPDNMDDLSLERKEYKMALREYNLRTAQRLLHVCKLNGGVFTKMGQQLASLNHALPAEYTTTLSELQDQALPVSFEVAKSAVERELGGPLKEFFSEFDESPIAAASLAQVHHAVTKDGKEVAVKIQYPLLAQQVDSDLWTVRQALLAIEKVWDINVAWIMPEIENALEAELNFESEKKNSRKIKHLFRAMPWVYIPEVYDDLSTDRILTMEYIHGVKVTDTKTIINKLGLKPEDVAGKVSSMFAEMVFCSGFVHCDPHPGNLFVRRHPNRPDEVFASRCSLYNCANRPKLCSWIMVYTVSWTKIFEKRFASFGKRSYSEIMSCSSNVVMLLMLALMSSISHSSSLTARWEARIKWVVKCRLKISKLCAKTLRSSKAPT
ncbi:hypothetical protein AC1031_000741 [Aphanomyces cochlioides]|nr:hypothetical protein AC1031_000741 [Aphanomyces cochlioides]